MVDADAARNERIAPALMRPLLMEIAEDAFPDLPEREG